MTDYDSIINMITEANPVNALGDEGESILRLDTTTRKITADLEFETMVGLTNDVNTNIIKIQTPAAIEGYNISECTGKVIKWRNIASGIKGQEDLRVIETGSEYMTLSWIVPPEAMTKAGQIEISLVFFTIDITTNKLTYRWSSFPYSELTVGQGVDEISIDPIAENSVIYVDTYSRRITLPAGLNRQIGLIGEGGINTLRFRIDRFFLSQDFFGENYEIRVLYTQDAQTYWSDALEKRLLAGIPNETLRGNHSDLIEFDWLIPSVVFEKEGTIIIAIQITLLEENKNLAVWKSAPSEALSIGTTLNGEYGAVIDDKKVIFGAYIPGTGIKIDKYEISLNGDEEIIFDAGDASEYINE